MPESFAALDEGSAGEPDDVVEPEGAVPDELPRGEVTVADGDVPDGVGVETDAFELAPIVVESLAVPLLPLPEAVSVGVGPEGFGGEVLDVGSVG